MGACIMANLWPLYESLLRVPEVTIVSLSYTKDTSMFPPIYLMWEGTNAKAFVLEACPCTALFSVLTVLSALPPFLGSLFIPLLFLFLRYNIFLYNYTQSIYKSHTKTGSNCNWDTPKQQENWPSFFSVQSDFQIHRYLIE